MGRILHGARVGLLAAFLVVCYPPIVEVTRFYSPHAALPGCIAVSLWALLGLVKGPTVRKAWLFAVSLAFGMLLHPSFAWSLAVPTAVGASYVAFFVRPPRRPLSLATTPAWLGAKLADPVVSRGLIPAGLLALSLVLLWYSTIGSRLFSVYSSLAEKEEIVIRGFGDVSSLSAWYVLTATGALSNVLALLIGAGLVAGALVAIWRRDSWSSPSWAPTYSSTSSRRGRGGISPPSFPLARH